MVALLCAVLFWPPPENEIPVVETAGSSSPPELDPDLNTATKDSQSVAESESAVPNSREAADFPIHHIGVQVLDHDNWLAVAHAKVYYITDAIRQQDPKLKDFRSKDGWSRLKDLPSVTTDGDGMAVLELPGRIAYLYCRSDTAKGMLKVKLGSEPITEVNYRNVIYLHRESTVEAKVLRHDGRPAVGVPVVVEGTIKPVGITDENGLATMLMPLSVLADIRKQKGAGGELTLRCKLPLMGDPTAVISEIGGSWHAEVQLPPYGGIEVVNLEPDWAYSVRDESYNSLSLNPREVNGALSAREDFIPVDAALILSQEISGSVVWDDQEMETEIASPSVDGEVVRVEAQTAQGVRFQGRLLNRTDEPVTNTGFMLWYLDEDGDSTFGFTMGATNELGEFNLFLMEPGPAFEETQYLWFIVNSEVFSNSNVQYASYVVENGGWGSPGEVELGDLEPLELEFLLSGKAIGPDGKPIRGVEASITRDLPASDGLDEIRFTVDEIATGNLADADKGEFRFEYSPTPFPCVYQLDIYSEDNEYREISFEPGTKDLIVELRQSVAVQFSYFGYPLALGVEFVLVAEDGSQIGADEEYIPQVEGSNSPTNNLFSDVPEGAYVFQAVAENGRLLIEIAGVNVRKGANYPSLRNIDLNAENTIQLKINFPETLYSMYVMSDQVVLHSPKEDGYRRVERFATKPAGMVVPEEYTHDDYMLVFAGCKPVSLRGRRDGETIQLQEYQAIPIEIPDVKMLLDQAEFWVRLESVDPGDDVGMHLLNGANVRINPEEESFEFALPGPGTYIPVWELLIEDWPGERVIPGSQWRGQPIHLDPERDSAGVILHVPAEFRAQLMKEED